MQVQFDGAREFRDGADCHPGSDLATPVWGRSRGGPGGRRHHSCGAALRSVSGGSTLGSAKGERCGTAAVQGRAAASMLTLAVCSAAVAGPPIEIVELVPSKDTSLVEIDDGSLGLALSDFVFAGRIGNQGGGAKLRRGLMEFDIAGSIPPGSTVLGVELHVQCIMTNTGDQPVGLHRALESWGEGESNSFGGAGGPATPGDATWLHRFWPDVLWSQVGGTFAQSASAVTTIGFAGAYAWTSTPGMVADVQAWLDQPSSNFGWLILGNEAVVQSVKALASRHYPAIEERPRLVVQYLPPSQLVGDLDGDGEVGGADLGILLGAWGSCAVPGPRLCPVDLNGDGEVDGADLGVLLAGWTG